MRKPPPTKKGQVDVSFIVNSLPDRGRSCWHLGAVWALSQFQENEVRPTKKKSFHSTFTAVIQFYWHWCVLLFLVVLRHVSRWTLHWQTGEESHGEFPEKAGWAKQCHQKSQWGEEPPILLPVSRQNPKQCGCLSVRTWMVCMCGEVKEQFLHHLCLMLHFATDSLWKNIYCILKQS